jgi:hypothetical protein
VPTDEHSGPRPTKDHPVDSHPAASPRARRVGKLLAAGRRTAGPDGNCCWQYRLPLVHVAASGWGGAVRRAGARRHRITAPAQE